MGERVKEDGAVVRLEPATVREAAHVEVEREAVRVPIIEREALGVSAVLAAKLDVKLRALFGN